MQQNHLWFEGRKISDPNYTRSQIEGSIPSSCRIEFWYDGEDIVGSHVWLKISGNILDMDDFNSLVFLRLLDINPMKRDSDQV